MKDLLKKRGIFIAAIAVLIALISIISATLSSGNSDLNTRASNVFTKPLKNMTNSLVLSLEQLYDYMYNHDQIVLENEQLKARVAELEEEYREYAEISEENERLRELLKISQRHSDFQYATATIISWSASNWSSTFTINKGSASGLALNDTIVTETGFLVGRITELSATSATVTTILDTTSSLGALLYTTGDTAIAQGDFTMMKAGNLKLTYLPDNAAVYTGDTIITSGKGGVYPEGLTVGTISGVVTSPSGVNDYAVVVPSVDFENLVHVYVITDYEVAE